jgi:hypothetical protein
MFPRERLHDLSDEAARWWWLTLAVLTGASGAVYGSLWFSWGFTAAVFVGGVAVLICLGHAAVFSFLLFREQVRMVNRGMALGAQP